METENKKKELMPINEQLNFSISNLARQLESGEIEPTSRSKDELRKCAMLFKSRGYFNSDIAEILNVDDRTVHRYIEKVKAENSLEFGIDFQKKLITEVINNWRARCHRLLRLSYSSDLTKYEQARAIFMWHQAEMDGLMLLEKLGYLSKWQGQIDVASGSGTVTRPARGKLIKLSEEQQGEFENIYESADNEIKDDFKKRIHKAIHDALDKSMKDSREKQKMPPEKKAE